MNSSKVFFEMAITILFISGYRMGQSTEFSEF